MIYADLFFTCLTTRSLVSQSDLEELVFKASQAVLAYYARDQD